MATDCFITGRTSSLKQEREGHGLDSQIKRCKDYSLSKGYRIVKIYREEATSGGLPLFQRPVMKQLLIDLDNHRIKYPDREIVVVFDDLKRFAREVEVHFMLKREIYGRGARVECPNFRFEDTPEGKFVETMLAASAELERNQNKRQVVQKMKARIEGGYWTFCTPPAMKNLKDPLHGKLLHPFEPFASIFKKAIEAFASDYINSRDEVTDFINSEYKKIGLTKKISNDGAQRVLINPLYAGYLEYKRWGVPLMKAKHEGFISFDTYQKVQKKLSNRSKPYTGKNYCNDFPLRQFILCTSCNKPMTGSWNTGRHTKYPNYFCKTKGCPMRWKVIRKQKVESEFLRLLSGVKPAPEVIDLTTAVFKDVWNIKTGDFQKENTQNTARIREIDLLVSSLSIRVAKASTEAVIASYETQIDKLQKEKEELEGKIINNPYTESTFGTALDTVMGTIKNPMGMWQSDKLEQKQVILSMYFEEKIPYDYYRGFGTASLAYPIQLMSQMDRLDGHYVEMSAGDAESEDAT